MGKTTSFKTIQDLLNLAIAREMASIEFYQKMAENLTEENLKQFFQSFVDEEKQHKSHLELELIKHGWVVKDPELNIEVERIPFDPKYLEEYQEALKIAVEREKISVRVYVEMASLTKDPELKEVLLQLAEEETRHKVIFQRELDALGPR